MFLNISCKKNGATLRSSFFSFIVVLSGAIWYNLCKYTLRGAKWEKRLLKRTRTYISL